MNWTFRPLDQWPVAPTQYRKPGPFKASYSDTLELLDREVSILLPYGRAEAVIQIDLTEGEIRLDGVPRANARPRTPGIIVSFESKHGPLQFYTDRFQHWQENLRAIALGLEALRKVERYGITHGDNQYTGWKQIGSGTPMGPSSEQMSYDDAMRFIYEAAGYDPNTTDPPYSDTVFRKAAKRLHPDMGGDVAAFQRLQAAKDVLDRFRSA